ncbi:MAG: hypothetical protein JWL86_1370 [Rhizobium sp.]|nr:hypothetical protein [Rhizobium sp.]
MVWPVYDEFDPVANPTGYGDFRYAEVMTDLWGTNFKPYVDQSGTPRIGTNIDLRIYLLDVATAILGEVPDDALLALLQAQIDRNYQKGDSGLLVKRLDKVMQDWAEDQPGNPEKFQFFTDAQSKEALAAALVMHEDNLENWGDIGIPESEERAVLASMLQQGADIGDIMDDLLSNGDRAGAWFGIRYMDREAEPVNDARAARRYFQSDVFELYNDPGLVDIDEAEDVGAAYARNRKYILKYENDFDPSKIGLGGGSDTIVDHLQPAMKSVADFYGIDIGRMEELLFVNLRGGGKFFGDQKGDTLNSRKNDDDLIVGTDGSNTIDGGAGNDVILGDTDLFTGSQSDRLLGGDGNDRLYGGLGVDVLIGGDGNDRLWGGGSSGDRLVGGKGNDTYFLTDDASNEVGGSENPSGPSLIGGNNSDAISEAGHGGTDTLIVYASRPVFNIKNVEKFKLAGDASGDVSVMLNQFDVFTLSDGDDNLTLTINKLQKTPIVVNTGDGADRVTIQFQPGVDPSQVLDGKGLTARFKFTELSAEDTIDLSLLNIVRIVTGREKIFEDKGFYLMEPGAKLDFMDHGRIDKTYNNSTDSWFVVKCGDDTPYGPEFIGNIDISHFDI